MIVEQSTGMLDYPKMMTKYNRREALEQGMRGSFGALALGSVSWPTVKENWDKVPELVNSRDKRVLSKSQARCLVAAAAEIIPAKDGKPSATEIGTSDYVEIVLRQDLELRGRMKTALNRLDEDSRKIFGRRFWNLRSKLKVQVLEKFEEDTTPSIGTASVFKSRPPGLFEVLRDLIYEGYYTNPLVWPSLGYQLHTPEYPPSFEDFDERLLEQVRGRTGLYREVD